MEGKMNHVRCSSQGRAWPLNNAYVVGSIPTLDPVGNDGSVASSVAHKAERGLLTMPM